MTGGAECFVTGGAECSVGTDFLDALSACCHPNLPLHVPHSCKWGSASPMSISLTTCLGITIAWGIAATWGGASVFTVGAGVGGIG